MAEPIRALPDDAVITGWDFSTGSVKCLAFELDGTVIAESRFPTDLYTEGGVSELNAMLLEGQALATTREIAGQLSDRGRLKDWVAGGISATHHTAGRIDVLGNPLRRLICWNDQTLAKFHAEGLKRLGGPAKVRELIGGPWAVRYSLSHLVKDESTLSTRDWMLTYRMLPHGPMAGGFLTGNFDVTSVSSAASTGMMDFRTKKWRREMLDAIADPRLRELAWKSLPKIIDMHQPIGQLEHKHIDMFDMDETPFIYPTLDDQAAGLLGGGAVDDGQVAIILGNSAVVNSSAKKPPATDDLDAMRLNWGPYLWMRCYSNGAQFLDRVLGAKPDWAKLEAAARAVPAGCEGVSVLPFLLTEPSLGVHKPRFEWMPSKPKNVGVLYRASLEALAYLITLGVKAHEEAGQSIKRVTVSGGIARSPLMLEILASVLERKLDRVRSSEGTALGAAVVALAGEETRRRKEKGIVGKFTTADAVAALVKFGEPVEPVAADIAAYRKGLAAFTKAIR